MCNQLLHWDVRLYDFHIRVELTNETNKLRWVYSCCIVVRIELHTRHFCQFFDDATVFPSAECKIIPFRRLKTFKPIDCDFYFVNLISL